MMVDFVVPYFLALAFSAALFRLPFLKFPIDEDFAFYIYAARFKGKGIEWKKDIFIMIPQWKTSIISAIYGDNPEHGVLRIRLFLMLMHSLTTCLVAYLALKITGNMFAAFMAGMLYAFFASVPALYAHSFNYEQISSPIVLASLLLLMEGYIVIPAMLLALTWTIKFAAGAYLPFFSLAVFWYYGIDSFFIFTLTASMVIATSFLIDYKLGFTDEESLRGLKARFELSKQLPLLKKKYGSVFADMKKVFTRTAPLWIAGLPALFFIYKSDFWAWYLSFISATVFIFAMQKFFSRYHYLPIMALLAIASGGTFHYLLGLNNQVGAISYTAIFVIAMVTAIAQGHLYLKPTATKTLAKDKKFDQFIYLPEIAKRIIKLAGRKQDRERIFVWGNYTQLYSLTGMPASDQFIHYAVGPWDTIGKTTYFDTVIGGIIKHRPAFIIKTFRDLDMDLLQNITGLKYNLVTTALSRFPIYQYHSQNSGGIDIDSLNWLEKGQMMEELTFRGEHAPGIDKTDYNIGQIDRAIDETRELLKLNEDDIDGRFYLGFLLIETGQMSEASSIFRSLAKIRPLPKTAKLNLANTQLHLNNTEDAKEYIAEEIKQFGDSPESKLIQGKIADEENNIDAAITFFKEALAMDPDITAALYETGRAYLKKGDSKNARKYFEKVYSVAKNNPALRMRTALTVAEMQKDWKGQKNALESFVDADPDNSLLRYAFASKLEANDETDYSLELFKQLTEETTDSQTKGSAWYRRALLSPEEERADMLKECLKLKPNHQSAKVALGNMEALNA